MPLLLGGVGMALGFLLYRRIVYGSVHGPKSLPENIVTVSRKRKTGKK